MKKMLLTSRRVVKICLAILSFSLATPSALSQSAQSPNSAASSVVVAHVAEVELTVTLPDGKTVIRRQTANKVEPGKVVIYTTRVSNKGKEAAAQMSLVTPIPVHTTLVENTLFGEAAATFSIDQGKSFAPLDRLIVERDGRQRPARLTDITHLRWQPEKALAPGAVLELGFKVQVN
jgi:uncharacterized repeat protein (TIGR01451 family)